MKVKFRGWRREVVTHMHRFLPVKCVRNKFSPQAPGPLSWHNGSLVYAKAANLSLSGNFLVEFEFEQLELESWLSNFAKEHPEEALALVARAQAEALIALAKPADK